MEKEKTELTEATAKVNVEAEVSPAIYTAMWPNQPIIVCEKHAQQLMKVADVIGIRVPLIPYLGEENCINCINEKKQG